MKGHTEINALKLALGYCFILQLQTSIASTDLELPKEQKAKNFVANRGEFDNRA